MNSNNIQNVSSHEEFMAMQQRLTQLEQFAAQFAHDTQNNNFMQQQEQQEQQQQYQQNDMVNDQVQPTAQLHSLEVRPSYTWSPPPLLGQWLALDQPLFNSPMLSDEEKRAIIEKHPAMESISYQPPETIPIAARKMSKQQSKQDMSLKRFQYLLSGIFRPLDVLGLELTKEFDNENTQRYLHMLADCHTLLRNISSQITEMRNTLAFQSINPTFTNTNTASSSTYTMSPNDFQAALAQQTTTNQTIQKASYRNNRRNQFQNNNNNNSYQQQ